MPVPKRKHSYGRKRRKLQHKGPKAPKTVKCPFCGADMIPHRACPECGRYGSEEDKSKEKTRKKGGKKAKKE